MALDSIKISSQDGNSGLTNFDKSDLKSHIDKQNEEFKLSSMNSGKRKDDDLTDKTDAQRKLDNAIRFFNENHEDFNVYNFKGTVNKNTSHLGQNFDVTL